MSFVTRVTLLNRIKEGDDVSWNEFYETYKPLVWLMGGDYNLTFSEKEELVPLVMRDFFNIQGKFTYDPSKGTFRSYFRQIIRSRIIKLLKARIPATADEELDIENMDIPTDDSAEEREYRAFVFYQALKEAQNTLEPRKVQAFIRHRLNGENMADIARTLGISQATGYNYSDYVFKQIQEIIKASDLL